MNTHGSTPKHKPGDSVALLTIIKRAGSTPNKAALWLCRCACGTETIVAGYALGKNIKSCGCLKRETLRNARWAGVGELPMSYWTNVLRNARVRSVPVEITINDAWCLFESQGGKCAISGLPISLRSAKARSYHGTASLDRIDNTLGYVAGNVQWVHKDINIMKKDHTLDRFIELCQAVVSHVLTSTS